MAASKRGLIFDILIVVSFIFCIIAVDASFEEPKCSKFHFEEHVLEKLVRLEHRFELMEEQNNVWKDTMAKTVEQLQQQVADDKAAKETMKVALTDVEDNVNKISAHTKQEIDRIDEDLTAGRADLKSTVMELIHSKQSTVDTMTDVITPVVVFKAREVANRSPSENSVLRYTVPVLNVGGAYDQETGNFTAPYAGLYMFAVQICPTGDKTIFVHIMAGQLKIAAFGTYSDSFYRTCSTGNAVALLTAGENVWVKYLDSYDGTVLFEDEFRWNSFSGVLIRRAPES